MTALRLSLLAGLMVPAFSSVSWSGEPTPPGTIVQISSPGEPAIDPEFLEDPPRMTFQLGGVGDIWLTGVDPSTGDLTTPGGKETLIDTGGAPLSLTNNGPEFGVSEEGWAIFYCKGGIFDRQIWMAEVGDSVTRQQITSGPLHQNQLASKGRGAPTFRILCVSPESGSDDVYWFDVDRPEERSFVEVFERGNNPCRWAEGAEVIPARDFDTGQLFLIDTADDSRRVITGDEGYKNDPRGWYAPEHDGELLVYAVSDDSELAVYRDLGGETWTRIAGVPIPDDSNLDMLYSPEPFVVNGKTFFIVGVRAEWTRDREIWILSLDGTYSVDLGRVGCVASELEIDRVTDESQDPGAAQASFFLARRTSSIDFGAASDGRARDVMSPSRGCP